MHDMPIAPETANRGEYLRRIQQRLACSHFFLLRYETEFTPCTGITAVARQERRHFSQGCMIAPWCPLLQRRQAEDDPLRSGKVVPLDWSFEVAGQTCRVLAAADEHLPLLFLEMQGRFQGVATPYDTPTPSALKTDALFFGLAVQSMLRQVTIRRDAFVWGADWETVPALFLLHEQYITALTLHNTFDECLEDEAPAFGAPYAPFCAPHDDQGKTLPARTALQLGLAMVDVATTVNRGFAHGLRKEPLQVEVMARHLQGFLDRVVGINNAAFSALSPEHRILEELLATDFVTGCAALFSHKNDMLSKLPETIRQKAAGKVLIVAMGRRVTQKQHGLLVESLRRLLRTDPALPLLVVFATVKGDENSAAILHHLTGLKEEFPANVICEDDRVPFYRELMAAADYNCMPSLYEPHGGAYEGIVVPIARAIDGLAEQICGLHPRGQAKVLNDLWHGTGEEPTGFLYREDPSNAPMTTAAQAADMLVGSPFNSFFLSMRDALSVVLTRAVELRRDTPSDYARLVAAALKRQQRSSWQDNFQQMAALIAEARRTRN